MLEVEHIANTRDHFVQSLIDLKSLSRAIRLGDWGPSTGLSFRTDKVFYTGQSLGGILGSIFVSMSSEVERAGLRIEPAVQQVEQVADGDGRGHVAGALRSG